MNADKTLIDFLQKCSTTTVPQSEMYNFINEYTNGLNAGTLQYLKSDLNRYVDNIKFTLILDTESVGTIDRPTTIKNHIENEQEFLSLVLTPRQKIDFVLNDIEDKKLNCYNDESIFTLEFNGFLRFYDMVEIEYKKIKTPDQPKATAEKGLTTDASKVIIDEKEKSLPYSIMQTEKFQQQFKDISKSFIAELENCKQHPEAPKWEGKQILSYYHILMKSKMFKRCNFTSIQKQLDEYYNLNTPTTYRPIQLKPTIADLKHQADVGKYRWINDIEQK